MFLIKTQVSDMGPLGLLFYIWHKYEVLFKTCFVWPLGQE